LLNEELDEYVNTSSATSYIKLNLSLIDAGHPMSRWIMPGAAAAIAASAFSSEVSPATDDRIARINSAMSEREV
jgi:hypothetical protein